MHQKSRVEQVSEIINRNSDMVYRLAFSMVKNVQDAEDIYQETFIRYIRKEPLFESHEHERAWFIRVTANLCKNLWKSARRQKMVSMEEIAKVLKLKPSNVRTRLTRARKMLKEWLKEDV